MPNPALVRVGDEIRILRVPPGDLKTREDELANEVPLAGHTADSIERIIEQSPVVRISRIDEFGCRWYDAVVRAADNTEEHHSLILYDDDTWELV